MGYLEETELEPKLTSHFNEIASKEIMDNFNRYIDDGFIIWKQHLDMQVFMNIINNLHPNIKFTFEVAKNELCSDGTKTKKLNFLDVTVILHENGNLETDIFLHRDKQF